MAQRAKLVIGEETRPEEARCLPQRAAQHGSFAAVTMSTQLRWGNGYPRTQVDKNVNKEQQETDKNMNAMYKARIAARSSRVQRSASAAAGGSRWPEPVVCSCCGPSHMSRDTAAEARARALRVGCSAAAAAWRHASLPSLSSLPLSLLTAVPVPLSLLQVISARAPRVDMLSLVFNKHCFAQTVENFFTLAFLVQKGVVRLSKRGSAGAAGASGGGSPALGANEGVDVELLKGGEAGAGKNLDQFIVPIDFAWWDARRRKWGAEPLMKHRAPIAVRVAFCRGREEEGQHALGQRLALRAAGGEKRVLLHRVTVRVLTCRTGPQDAELYAERDAKRRHTTDDEARREAAAHCSSSADSLAEPMLL